VIFLFNINNIFSSEMTGMSPSALLCSKIFSSTTSAGITKFVLTIGNLYFLFLFNLLYGIYIFNDANNCGIYIFSRLKDRRGWFNGKVRTVILFSLCYMALVVICFVMVSLWQIRSWPDRKMLATALLMFCFLTVLAALTTTAISALSFWCGSVVAFLAVYFIEALMVLSLLMPSDTTVAKVWDYINPFGGIFSLDNLDAITVFRLFYIVALFGILAYMGGKYIARLDIGLKDVEAE
jgi:hypothetical protein